MEYFTACSFGKKLYSNQLNLPKPACLPNKTEWPQSFVLVRDEAFALHQNILRLFPGRNLTYKKRVFNYRLSRARRLVECSFGILENKWRVLHTSILVEPDFTDKIIKACCILHNFVRRRDGYNFDDTLSNMLEDFQIIGSAGARQKGIQIRDYFAEYFVGSGAIPYQNRYA